MEDSAALDMHACQMVLQHLAQLMCNHSTMLFHNPINQGSLTQGRTTVLLGTDCTATSNKGDDLPQVGTKHIGLRTCSIWKMASQSLELI